MLVDSTIIAVFRHKDSLNVVLAARPENGGEVETAGKY